jgi:hypothetical protein
MTMSGVARRLGLKPSGGVHSFLVNRIAVLGLDTSHMTGRAVVRDRSGLRRPTPLAEVLVKNSAYTNTGTLRKRLIKAGLKEACCESCGLREWLGVPIRLELDHINGDRRDNRIENLRILCPNCHSVTETWCTKKSGRRSPTGEASRLDRDQ